MDDRQKQPQWSAPDDDGICTLRIDVGARSTLRGKRRRRCRELQLDAAAIWPADWLALARDWLSLSTAPRWRTVQEKTGHRRNDIRDELLQALLRAGWIELSEKREDGRWLPTQLRFTAYEACRARLGLHDRDASELAWQALRTEPLHDPLLQAVGCSLDAAPRLLAIRRYRLLLTLRDWQTQARYGTRRQFALHASGTTKGIADADWEWLEKSLDLEAAGISSHIPLLSLRAPLCLHAGEDGGHGERRRLDLRLVPDVIGLSAETLLACTRLDGRIEAWRLVENLTSFQHAARRYGDTDAVVWLPGHAPNWWLQAMQHLLSLHPAPAWIAADPDPSGILIACRAGELWDQRGLAWHPWQMQPSVLDALPARQALHDSDLQLLQMLRERALPDELKALAEALQVRGHKGEQEGIVL